MVERHGTGRWFPVLGPRGSPGPEPWSGALVRPWPARCRADRTAGAIGPTPGPGARARSATVDSVPGPTDVALALASVTCALPRRGEDRPGQLSMAEAVASAIEEQRHLVVGAGTGTGKSLAYIIPAVLSGRSVVVATVTKALQDQLAQKALPPAAGALRAQRTFRFAVLKGRSNYLCRQRATEVGGAEDAGLAGMALFDADSPTEHPAAPSTTAETVDLGQIGGQLRRLIAWAATSPTGDRAELDFEPNPRAWAALSVSARECPGAFRCPSGTICFAEKARERAAAADVVVVNTHLYATHVASDGAVLPEHDVVVLDEAHAVEDVMTEALGVEVTAGRLRAVAQAARGLVGPDGTGIADGVAEVADRLDAVLAPLAGRRVLTGAGANSPASQDSELSAVLELARGRLDLLTGALRRGEADGLGKIGLDQADEGARRNRALLAVGHLGDEVSMFVLLRDEHVAWVEASGAAGRTSTLRAAPVEVGPLLGQRLWPNVTAVLTSATVPPPLEERLGLPAKNTDHLEVGSPFPFETCALLYCPRHLPDPRRPDARQAVHEELGALITAAGGRTLALFTSWRAMHEGADALGPP